MRIAALPWDIYSQAVSEKRLAQTVAFRARLERGLLQHTRSHTKEIIEPSNSEDYGGDDGARTRDLCRDRAAL